MTTKRRNWTETEQTIIVRTWLYLLEEQEAGRKTNKAALCRATLPLLEDRSRGSYELKMMNVSAAAAALGLPIVKGYKAAGNYQRSLKDELQRQRSANQ